MLNRPDQTMPKKQKLDAHKCLKYFNVLCDDVVVFLLLFLEIDDLVKIMRVTKSGVFSRCLGKALLLFPDVELWDDQPPGRIEAVAKHCLGLRTIMCDLVEDLDVIVKIVSNAWHTVSHLDISVNCMSSVLSAGVTLCGLKELVLAMYEGDEILFRAKDFPNITSLELGFPYGDVHKSVISFISSELQKFRLLERLQIYGTLSSGSAINVLEPPPSLKHLLISCTRDFTRFSGKFPQLESLDLCIENCRRTVGLASFLNGFPPLKKIRLPADPVVFSSVLHVLNRSRDTLTKWQGVQRVTEVLGGQNIVFPQLTEISLHWCTHLDKQSSKILARVAPNMTSLSVTDLAGESLGCLHKHGINLKYLAIRWKNVGALEALADATVFPGLMSLRVSEGTRLAERQHLRNIRKDCVVSLW